MHWFGYRWDNGRRWLRGQVVRERFGEQNVNSVKAQNVCGGAREENSLTGIRHVG